MLPIGSGGPKISGGPSGISPVWNAPLPPSPTCVSAAPADGVSLLAAPAAEPQASARTQPNRVQIVRWTLGGQEVGMKALLPAIPGGGQLLPVNLALEVTKDANGQSARAFVSDALGNPLLNHQGQPRELPVYSIDEKYFIPTDTRDPQAPYVLVEPDSKGGIGYGLADGLKYTDLAQGYKLARSEMIEPDGTKVMRFNETNGPLVQGGGSSMAGMMGMMGMGNLIGSSTSAEVGRSRDYSEVRVGGGKTTAADVHYDFLANGERPTAELMKKMMDSASMKGSRKETSRTFSHGNDGQVVLAPAGKAKATMDWFLGRGDMIMPTYAKNIVTVTPLSAEFGGPQGQMDLLKGLMDSSLAP